MRRGLTLFLVMSALVLTRNAAAQSDQPDQSQEDRWLEETVQRILEDRGYGSVGVQAENGAVVLTGTVESARDKVVAIQSVFEIAEVQAVESALRLRNSGTPEVEEEIWLTLFREGLADGLEEVIVEDGVASVSGRVPNEETRNRIFRAVRSVTGVEAVTSALIADVAEPPRPEPEPEPENAPEYADLLAPEPPAPPEPPDVGEAEPQTPTPPAPAPEPQPVSEPEPKPSAVAKQPVPPESPEVAEAEPAPELQPAPEPEQEPPAAEHEATAVPEAPRVAKAEPEPEPERAMPPPAAPEPEPEPAPRPARAEREIVRDVAEQIIASNYTVFDHLQFFIESGEVSLGGFVTSSEKLENLEAAIGEIPGVASVRSDVRVLPSSSADDRLRKNLFRRLYEDPAFAEFADLENPPVHIIVDAKQVTLVGTVESRIQQMTAEAIVRTTFGVRVVRNRLRVRQ